MPYSQFSLTFTTGLFAFVGEGHQWGWFDYAFAVAATTRFVERPTKKQNCCVPYWVVALDKWI